MAINTVAQAISRIKAATMVKPIAVFVETLEEEGKEKKALNVVFARTIECERMKKAIKPFHSSQRCPECGHVREDLAYEWIGDFHNRMNMDTVREFLRTAIGE